MVSGSWESQNPLKPERSWVQSRGCSNPTLAPAWDRTREVQRCRRERPKPFLISKPHFHPFSSPGFTLDSRSRGWRGQSALSEFFPALLLCRLLLRGSISAGAGLLAGCSRLPRPPWPQITQPRCLNIPNSVPAWEMETAWQRRARAEDELIPAGGSIPAARLPER